MSTPTTSTAPVGPEGSSNPWNGGFIRWFSNIINWIKGLSPASATVFQTGWVEPVAGIRYRRYGKVVEILISKDGTYNKGYTKIATGVIPAELIAGGVNRRGALWLGYELDGHAYVNASDGSIYVLNSFDTPGRTAQGQIIYTVN